MPAKRVHKSDCDVYIGRGEGGDFNFAKAVSQGRIGDHGWLGNPYKEQDYDRENAVKYFARDLRWAAEAKPVVRRALFSLYGKRLGCYCRPDQTCHGDELAKFVNKLYWEDQT